MFPENKSTESEYTRVSKVGCEVLWMRYLLEEFGYDISRPSPIYVDNASSCNPGGNAFGAPINGEACVPRLPLDT